jgi:DNA repair protein RadC
MGVTLAVRRFCNAVNAWNRSSILFPGIQFGGYVENRGIDLYCLAREKGLEGIIAKRKTSTYRPGKRSPDWLKIKARSQQEFVVCGFTEGKGSRKHFGALLLGGYRNGRPRGALHLNPGPVSATSRLLRLLPLSVGRFASLRFRPKNMFQHIFQFESELQNSSQEAAPSSPSLSPTVSEKLTRYGSSALSGLEHLTLIVGKEELALALVCHFGSIKALARASIQQLLQFLPRRKAETLVAALSMSIAESEHARSEAFDSPESVYRACADLRLFNQEVLRVILLDTRQRLITMIDVTKGGLNESLAHPRDIFRPVIAHSANSFILAHNL